MILGVDVAAVEAIPDRDPGRHGPEPTTLPPIKTKGNAFHGASSTKLYRMHGLGYSAEKIACILRHPPRHISEFVRRITALDGTLLAKPRTRKEQREFDRERKRAARKRAARKAPRWPWRCPPDPPPELVKHVVAPHGVANELGPAAPPPVEPSCWHDVGDLRRPLDPPSTKPPPVAAPARVRRPGANILSDAEADEVLELHALGWNQRDLADSFGVCKDTIKRYIRGWRRPDAMNQATSEPPQIGHRWRVQGDRRRTDPD